MTLKRKTAICILTSVCLGMILLSFETLSIVPSDNYLSSGETELESMEIHAELNFIDADLLALITTPLKALSTLVASMSIFVIVLTYGVYRKHLKKANMSIFAPLIIWLTSLIVIYFYQPQTSWQVILGVSVLCLLSFGLTLSDQKGYETEN